jgi:type I restriction enzyme S subunit
MTGLNSAIGGDTGSILFEHFATLATAPDGIPRLRELILQLAVQGKLGTQDAGDEPASILFELIKKERIRLVKEGKIQKEKTSDFLKDQGEPFSIPKSWIWTRVGQITFNRDGERIPIEKAERATRQGNYDYYGASGVIDTIDNFLFDKSLLLIGEDGANLVNRSTPIAFMAHGKYWVNNHAHVLDGISLDFLRYLEIYINSIDLRSYLTGMAQPKMNQAKMNSIPVPLPPLAEQHRIVAKVDRLMALCDELEARQQQERAGCLRLGTASLTALQNAESPEEFERQWAQVCEAFELIFDCPENVGVLRQTILQLAVQGRLVRQEPGDEPAEKLVERIRKEKELLVKIKEISKTTLTPEIDLDEIPFSIPNQWSWTRLDHITYISTGKTPSTTNREYYLDGTIPWITSSLTSQDLITCAETYITERAVLECSLKIFPKGTLLVALYGQGKTRGQVSELGIPSTTNQACAAIVFWKNNEVLRGYLKLVLTGNYDNIRSISAGGAQPNLNVDKIKRTLIPLPPLAEQHRIVARVDALMALCDELEARLKERSAVQERFAKAVGKQVAG